MGATFSKVLKLDEADSRILVMSGMSACFAALFGNLAPDGCVVKQSAVAPEMLRHKGPARVFNSEEEAIAASYAG